MFLFSGFNKGYLPERAGIDQGVETLCHARFALRVQILNRRRERPRLRKRM